MLSSRPIIEFKLQDGLDEVLEDQEKNVLVYIKKCKGNLSVRTKLTKVIIDNCSDLTVTIEQPLISGLCELVGCQNVTLVLSKLVPVITIDKTQNSTVFLEDLDYQTKDFSVISSNSTHLALNTSNDQHSINDSDEAQYITRLIENAWLTERVIRENGYQTTERELKINLARAERDSIKLGEAMASSLHFSKSEPKENKESDPKGKGKGKAVDLKQPIPKRLPKLPPPSSFFPPPPPTEPPVDSPDSSGNLRASIQQFKRNSLKPTTTVVRTVEDMGGAIENTTSGGPNFAADGSEITEYFDDADVLQAKVKKLADLVRSSKYCVAFTGAGISASSGIATYRGPQGFWTRRDKGLPPPPASVKLDQALPTSGHMALVGLKNSGHLKHLVSTNVDGLHRRSGFSRDEMSELHGNCYRENCSNPTCGKEYFRNFDASARGARKDHKTGRKCTCGSDLVDNIINFGENLPIDELGKAEQHSDLGDLALVLGTSMKVSPDCHIPEKIWKKKPNGAGKMVIVNLQKTSFDQYCHLRIFGETDLVLEMLMAELGIDVPKFSETVDSAL